MSPEDFEALVEQAMDELPGEFTQRLENISIAVEDYPSDEVLQSLKPRPLRESLLGVYIGVPYNRRPASPLSGKLPDRVELYQKNIESICRDDREVKEQIKKTFIHEIGHYFGFGEEDLRRLHL
jgi:predicted Zn-dependent protease with MMP-like domain